MKDPVSAQTRHALVAAVRERYQAGTREDKTRILEEFIAISGYHRKSAIRVLNGSASAGSGSPRGAARTVYDQAVLEALQVLWEASDRVCGKRLKALLPILLPALERHGHLQLESQVRCKVLAISASSIDRLLRNVRGHGPRPRRRRAPAVARRVPVRTFADWDEPAPGYMEMDLVAHCGQAMAGSFVYTLTLTDIASGWTECVPLPIRDATLVVETVAALRPMLPFVLRGLDVDNGTEFINDMLASYCQAHAIELTRSRPYHKNDQAWVEQKNGSVVRRLVGYRRLEGDAAAETLKRLYRAARLFVNCFQPSFQLKEKIRVGARVTKRYHPPQTPCARLLAADSVSEVVKSHLQGIMARLDPLALLDEIRRAQQQMAFIADSRKPESGFATGHETDLDQFLASLTNAWRDGEVRPTHQSAPRPVRHWRTRQDPFEAVWPEICQWLANDPTQTAKALLERLQRYYPDVFPSGQLRTLQRRIKAWRRDMAHRLVFGLDETPACKAISPEAALPSDLNHEHAGNNLDEATR